MEALLAQLAGSGGQQLIQGGTELYKGADEKEKTLISTGIAGLGKFGFTTLTTPIRIVMAATNFVINAGLLTTLLIYRNRAQFNAGKYDKIHYVRDSFIQGFGLAAGITVFMVIADIFSSGATLPLMFGVYIFSGIGMLILSMINPEYLHDIDETKDGEKTGRTSAFKLWMAAFLPIFVFGLILSIVIGYLQVRVGGKITKMVLDTLVK